MNVPLLDLKAQFDSIRPDVLAALHAVVESQQFIMGPAVAELETALAAYCHTRAAVACASGTDALLLPLRALIQPGDEVITSPFTFFASAGAVANAGGRPVFVDIDPATFNLRIDQVEAAITPRTRVIIPVHLFGQMVEMEALLPLAARRGIAILEDAAQAIGARRKIDGQWRLAGELGLAAAFSFFPSKNLGAWGDGGCITTQDEALAERLKRLRTHGGAKQYHHDEVGTNSRLDTLQAAVLTAKLPWLDRWSAARRGHAASTTRRCPASRALPRRRWTGRTSTFSTSTPSGATAGTGWRPGSRNAGSGARCTTRGRCICSPALPRWGTAREPSPRPNAPAVRCCPFRCIPN
jgi:dTDP-4-amino-4,6-dideoxygalactose transaminase